MLGARRAKAWRLRGTAVGGWLEGLYPGSRGGLASALWASGLGLGFLRAEDGEGPARQVKVGPGPRPATSVLPPPWPLPHSPRHPLALFPPTGLGGLALLSLFLSSGSWCQGPASASVLVDAAAWGPGSSLGLDVPSSRPAACPGHGLQRPSPDARWHLWVLATLWSKLSCLSR